MEIHSLFILQEGGACIYQKHFSDQFKGVETDLITPFFSAILSFSERVVSKKLEVLEMSDLRFVFKKEKGYVFCLVSDEAENYLFINSRLELIINVFFRNHADQITNDCELFEDIDFENRVKNIINGKSETKQIQNYAGYTKLIEYFSSLISQKELVGAAIVTTRGTIIYSSLTENVLFRSMRELEIRYMSGTFDLPELFYTLGNGQKVCERVVSYKNFINLLVILQFDKEAQLGMVDYSADTIANKLKNLLN